MNGRVTKKQLFLLRYLEKREKEKRRFPYASEIARDPNYPNSNTKAAREALYYMIESLIKKKLIKRMEPRQEPVKFRDRRRTETTVRPIRLTNRGKLYLKALNNIDMVKNFVDMLEETEDKGASILKELELD